MDRKLKQPESNPKPLMTVSIVSHGDARKVLQLLESMSDFEESCVIQVVVTDNLGHDVTGIDHSPWKSLIILRNEHPWGFSRNQNRAFRFATGKYFCVLNPDVIFDQAVFRHLIQLLENGQADIVAPLIKDTNGVIQDSYRKFPTSFELIQRRLPGYSFSPPSKDALGRVWPDWVAGIFMLMRSETYHVLKGFDEKYRLYFEDVDFCARAQLADFRLLVDTRVSIQHYAHRASRNEIVYFLWHIQSAFRFFTSPVYKKIINRSK